VSGVLVRLRLAGGFPVSTLWKPDSHSVARAAVVVVLNVPVPGLRDRGHGAAQDPYTAAPVVLGGISGDDRDAGGACAFPMMSSAASVLLRRRWATSNCRRRAISDCSALGRPTLAPADFPDRTPASRSLRHSVIWEEYRPCWRRYAPPVPLAAAASYEARCSSF